MCFVKPKENGGLKGPHGEELLLDLNNVGKESPIEILRKTPKSKIGEELTEAQIVIKKIVDKHISAITRGKDNGDNL